MPLRDLLPDPGPMRVLVTASLVNTLGAGMFLATSVIYYTRVLDLSPTAVGVAMSVAAFSALLGAAPLGHLADRLGPRETLIAATALSGALAFLLLVVRGIWPLMLLLCAVALAQSATHSARGAVIGAALPPEQRTRGRAYLRSVTNGGIMVGTMLAGVALAVDTPLAYRILVAGNGVSFLIAAAICLWLPPVDRVPRNPNGPALVALRDRPYLAVTALNGVLCVHYGILEVGLPLWVVDHTEAPRWLVAAMLAINCAGIVLFQVRASRGTDETPGAARALARSGFVVALACLLYAAAAGHSMWLAVAVLVAGSMVHVTGELLQAAGAFGISYSLAPEGRHGQYQGTFGMGFQVSQMAGPVLITLLPLTFGTTGWTVLAVMFAVTGTAVPVVARWAERSRVAATPAVAG